MKNSTVLTLLGFLSVFNLSQAENNIAVLKSLDVGDRACYVNLQNSSGQIYQSLANFEICDLNYLVGQKVQLTYEQGNVLASSCNGDMDCNQTETVWLINNMTKHAPRESVSTVASHCFSNEKTIFSCNTNSNQVISICASKSLNNTNAYMQYRFGAQGSFPSFVYPMNHNRASNFFYSGVLSYSGGGGAYLKFVNGTYVYVVYTGIGRGWAKQGMVINEGKNEIARYSCTNPWASEIGPDLFQITGLQVDPYGFEIPIDYDE